ncbi:MAG: glutamate-1-semialdehyde 2,1-aminomutase [Synergistaceae bacterium]|jgi:glutamate-1-semialdehyde 2,1-aminomutase|nr:glutamate-1-semialdehyde 2,1-aminomutase [Synergistaceae bacterium]
MEDIAKSGELYERACLCLVGGVNSPVRAWKSVGGTPLFMTCASGAMLRDAEGRTYRDYVGSWGPMILGHANPDVVRAISEAASRSSSFGAPCEAEVELAEIITGRFPSIDRIRFVNSGTEAVMTALRLARGYTGRDRVVKFAGCYHGHSDSMLVSAGSGALTSGIPTSPGITASAASDTIVLPFNSEEAVRRVFEECGESIAAVITEPWPGNMGLVPPMPGFLESLRKLTKDAGALLIFDEVITGFRVPEGGVQNMMNIRPDLTCLGKIIGGGLPVGALGGDARIMDHLAPTGPVYQAGTLAGNPVAMAAGIATLRRLTQTAYQKLDYAASSLGAGLKRAAMSAGIDASVSRLGSALGLFFASRPPTDLASAQSARTDLYPAFFHGMLERGDYFAPSAYEAIFVSLEHTSDVINATIENAAEVFRGIAAQ